MFRRGKKTSYSDCLNVYFAPGSMDAFIVRIARLYDLQTISQVFSTRCAGTRVAAYMNLNRFT